MKTVDVYIYFKLFFWLPMLFEVNANANDVHFVRRIGMFETSSNFKEIILQFYIGFQRSFRILEK